MPPPPSNSDDAMMALAVACHSTSPLDTSPPQPAAVLSSADSTDAADGSPPPAAIKHPMPTDIKCGHDRTFQKHPGNVQFTAFISKHIKRYTSESITKQEKMEMTQWIVRELKTKHNARFIRKEADTPPADKSKGECWYEIHDRQAREKVSHALRFCVRRRRCRPQQARKKSRQAATSTEFPPKNKKSPCLTSSKKKAPSTESAASSSMTTTTAPNEDCTSGRRSGSAEDSEASLAASHPTSKRAKIPQDAASVNQRHSVVQPARMLLEPTIRQQASHNFTAPLAQQQHVANGNSDAAVAAAALIRYQQLRQARAAVAASGAAAIIQPLSLTATATATAALQSSSSAFNPATTTTPPAQQQLARFMTVDSNHLVLLNDAAAQAVHDLQLLTAGSRDAMALFPGSSSRRSTVMFDPNDARVAVASSGGTMKIVPAWLLVPPSENER